MNETVSSWYVYIVQCSDGTYYTGITNNIAKRVCEHNSGPFGAKYTMSRRPVRLVYQEKSSCRSAASKREYMIKRLKRSAKEKLVRKSHVPELPGA